MSLEELQAEPRVRAVREAIGDGWIVGGTVRDALLDRPLRDLDLAVPGDPAAAARAVGRALGGPWGHVAWTRRTRLVSPHVTS